MRVVGTRQPQGGARTAGPSAASEPLSLVKLPDVACSHASGKRALVLTCTTRGVCGARFRSPLPAAQERAIDAGSVRSSRVIVTLAASLALADPR